MRIKNALSSNILILLLAGTTAFIFNSNALALPGDLFASDVATNSIVVYAATDGTKTTFATGLNSPQGLAFDHSGNLYVADAGSGNVFKFTVGGVRTTFASGLDNPIGLVIDGPDLLVAENGGDVVSAIPLAGGPKRTSIPDITGPLGLSFDGINRYVANGDSVFKVAPDGTMIDIDPGDGSRGVTLSPSQPGPTATPPDVFVSTDDGRITRINPHGTIIPFASGLVDPWGLAFRPKRFSNDVDGVGNLFVADTGAGQIFEFTRDGSRTPFGPTGGGPNFLAFQTIFPIKVDFNGDGKSDILWQNNSTGARVVWFMNGTSLISSVNFATLGTSWNIVGSEDFNGDLNSDILWQNSVTGERVIWLMHGTSLVNSVPLGIVGTSWNIVGSGDFNADSKPDILWQNSVTGERVIWLMNGTSLSSTVSLGVVGISWSIVGSGDFNADGMPDILWQNSVTGERVIWLMNGTSLSSTVSLGVVGTSWNIGGSADYNGDSQPDILWQNSVTGERVIWLMNGTSLSSTVSLGIVGTAWDIRNF
jgi:hypothetical protein